MSAHLETSKRPTRDEFDDLLTTYVGAITHVRWARENLNAAGHAVAVDAAVVARNAVIDAAMAACPGCGMELK